MAFFVRDKESKFFTNDKWRKIKGKGTFFFLNTNDCIWMTRVKVEIFDAFLIPTRMNAKSFFLTFASSLSLFQITFWLQIVVQHVFWDAFMMSKPRHNLFSHMHHRIHLHYKYCK